MPELKRTLGLTEVVFFGVGSILGAGVYALIGKVAGISGYLIWLSFLIASIAAMCTAFSYAELSAAFPKAGGEFEYAKQAFGRKTGIFLGMLISLNGIISGATVAIGFGGYLAGLIDINSILLALGAIVVLFGINVAGIRESSTVNIVFTTIEFSGLVFVIWTAWPYIGETDLFVMPEQGINGIMAASALAFFAYIGFEEIVKLAEETHNPEKTIPKALFISNVIVLIIYSLVAISIISVIPPSTLGTVDNPLAVVIGEHHGQIGILIISIIALFATSNTILSNMLGSSRVILDMSDEIKILRPFSGIWAKRQTPVAALLLILAIMAGFVMIGKIETVALLATFTIFITFIVVNIAIITLRIKKPSLHRPYRIPWSVKDIPVISIIGTLFTLTLLGYNLFALLTQA